MGKGVVSILPGRISRDRWQQGRRHPQPSRAGPPAAMPREISVAWSSTLVCGAQLSQQWAGTRLPYILKVVHSISLGPFDKCLGTPDGKWGISPGAYLWMASLWRHGFLTMCASRCVSLPGVSALIMCAGNLAVSPYQMCLAGSSLKRETT